MKNTLKDGLNRLRSKFLYFGVSIPDEEWNSFCKIFSLVGFAKEEYLIRQGEHEKYLNFLLQGSVRMFYTQSDGLEFIKNLSAEDELVASFSSLLTKEVSTHSIQTLEESVFIRADYNLVQGFFDKHMCWQKVARIICENLFVIKEEREYEMVLLLAKDRYKRFCQRYPQKVKRFSNNMIASYLGMNPSTLSRIKKSN